MEENKRKYEHKISAEERSAICRANAAKRKRFGRIKGVKNRPSSKPRAEHAPIYVNKADRERAIAFAHANSMTIVEWFHYVVEHTTTEQEV